MSSRSGMQREVAGELRMRGVWPALATPFDAKGGFDERSFRRLIDHHVQAKVNGFVICGSSGEAATLNDEEYRTVVRAGLAAIAGRAPALAGISVSATSRACELAVFAKEAGAQGVLLTAPPYNKPGQAGIQAHFKAVHDAAGLPIVAYNIPGRTGVSISPATLGALHEAKIICGVKEASGSLDQVIDTVAACGSSFAVLAGDDSLVLAMLASGGTGVISASANVWPHVFVDIVTAWERGENGRALAAQLAALPLVRALFLETNPAPVKCALRAMGLIASEHVRLPLLPVSDSTKRQIANVIEAQRIPGG